MKKFKKPPFSHGDFDSFDLDLDLFDPLLHLAQILQHLEGILDDVDLGLAVVDDLDGGLHDLFAKLGCPENGFKIEGKTVDLATGEDLQNRLLGEGFTAALGVRELEAAHKAEHLDIDLGHELTDEGIPLVAVLVNVAGADDHVGVGMGGELVVDLLDDVGPVGQVSVGEHDDVTVCGQECGTDGTALSLIVRVAHHADIGEVQCLHGLVTAVLRTVVGENDLVIGKSGRHILMERFGCIGNDAVLIVHRNAQGNLLVEYGFGVAHGYSFQWKNLFGFNIFHKYGSQRKPRFPTSWRFEFFCDRPNLSANNTVSWKRVPVYAPRVPR